MAQNIFMASMFFFVPINKVNIDTLEKRVANWHPIECQSIFQNISAKCEYTKIPYYNQPFYYNTALGNNTPKERKVKLNVNILRYVPFPKDNMGVQYYLTIGTYIDKCFESINNGEDKLIEICNAQDLAMLKRAFYTDSNRNDEKTGLYYPKEDPVVFHRFWLEKIVEEFDLLPDSNIAFDASATSIRAVNSNFTVCPTTAQDVKLAFEKCYYDDKQQSYDKVLDGVNANRFAYGVSEGNENFASLPDDLIRDFLVNSYSNNHSERIFVTNNRLTFFCTHYPYEILQETKECKVSGSITDIDPRMVLELCHCLFIKKKLNDICSQMNDQVQSGKIKRVKDRLNQLLQTKLFNMNEADNRATIIFRGLGIESEQESTRAIVDSYLTSKQFKFSRRRDFWMAFLSVFTVILGILSIMSTIYQCEINHWMKTSSIVMWNVEYKTIKFLLWLAFFIAYFAWMEYLAISNKLPSWKQLMIKLDNIINYIHRTANGQ